MFYENAESKITDSMKQMLVDSVSNDPAIAAQAGMSLKAALATPLQKGTLFGDTVTGLFNMPAFEWGQPVEFPLDFISPSEVKLHVAYTLSHEGYIPHRTIEGDFITVKLYRVGTSCDWSRFAAKSARWDVVGRAMAAAESAMVRKRNNDGFRTLISSASDRGISIADTTISAGLFGKRVVALSQTVMRRNAGGNSSSIDHGTLTHMAMSPESVQDVRSWDVTQVDEITRREIFIAGGEQAIVKIFGVELVTIDEFGEGQEYQLYFNNVLGGTTPSSKNEIALGLDLTNAKMDSFVMPWLKQDNGQFIEMRDDPTFARHNRAGFWMDGYMGCAVLDSRRVLLIGI